MRLKRRYLSVLSTIIVIFVLFRIWLGRRRQQPTSLKIREPLKFKDVFEMSNSVKWSKTEPVGCSMTNCFNWTKCMYTDQPKVYIYPSSSGSLGSSIYEKILRIIRESFLFTNNTDEACLFVLAIDTIDRDKLSENYVKDIGEQIRSLPQHVWANGTNHLIFNLYFGSFPDYGYNLGFDTENAMIAWASANAQAFRFGFDVSFPLFHKEHPFRTIPKKFELQSLRKDRYKASFKGKRYVFGIGSETRNILYKLHNNDSTIIATTCKHTVLWKKFEDDRCALDNENYEKWNYDDLMKSSTFCLTPRGRRLGSFRFLEALGMGCIPIVLSDDWLLPLFEMIDWSKAVIPWHEKNLLFISDYLSEFPESKIFEMKRQSLLLYHRHFSSIENIVISSIQSVFERIRRQRVNFEPINWNSMIDLKVVQPGFTIVFQAILRDSTRLNRIILEMSKLNNLRRIILLWPKDRGPLPKPDSFNLEIEILIFETAKVEQSEYFKIDFYSIFGDFVLFLDERIPISCNELNVALNLAVNNPSKMLVYYSSQFKKLEEDNRNVVWALSYPTTMHYSFGWMYLAIVHKHFIHKYQIEHLQREEQFSWFTSHCHVVLFNFVFASWTLNAPMWLASSGADTMPSWASIRNENVCFNKIVHEMYGDKVPLISSHLRYTLQ